MLQTCVQSPYLCALGISRIDVTSSDPKGQAIMLAYGRNGTVNSGVVTSARTCTVAEKEIRKKGKDIT